MKSTLLRIVVVLGMFALIVMATLYFINNIPQTDPALTSVGHQKTIAELASSYYGTLSRPLIPQTSLGLPLLAQGVLSLLLALGIFLIAKFSPHSRKLVMIVTVVTILRHLLWRGFETLDVTSPVSTGIGLLVYGAELLAFFALILGYFQVVEQTDHKPISLANFKPEQLPSVDILVCTYNEPVSVLYRTMVGCNSIDYPNKKVYLCDDGNRAEMAELAQKLGVNYITRTENTHAKAGNLNNAMAQTQGDLILVFDADHVPCKHFLQETVGFFTDPKLAFVQTPQHFFTPDPFQRNLVSEETINNEQDLFFHVIQPGNDYWNAAFFAGSGALFRRVALDETKGFAVETITEDTHTGLRLHCKGWKSLYYNRDLAAGLAQDTFADFVKQRLRWARGMTQIMCFDNPLFVRGLTLAQRICYLSGIWYFFHGFPRLVFMVAPLFFLLFGFKTINAGFVEVLIYYLPSFLCLTMGYSIISRGVRHSFWSEVYETALCVYLMLTTFFTFLSPARAKFRVTPKGTMNDRLNFNWQIVFPQVVIAALTIVGIGMAIVRAIYTPEYVGGIYTNMFWSMYNLVLLLGAIYVAQERPQFRLSPRIFKRIRCEVRLLDGTIAVGYTTNISESGIALVFEEPIPVSGTVTLKILDWDINESSVLQAQAVRSSVDANNRHFVGFRIVNRTDEQHQKLIRHMFANADIWNEYHTYTDTGQSFLNLMLTPLRLTSAIESPVKRRTVRMESTLSCVIEANGQYIIGFSNEVSETGLSVFVKEAQGLQMGQPVRVRIQWANGGLSDLTAQIVRIEDAGRGQFKIGLNFVNLTRDQRLDVIQQIYRPREGLIRVAPSVNRILNCRVTTEDGHAIQGFTQEISEMGVAVGLQDPYNFTPEQKIKLEIQWDDGSIAAYPGLVKAVRDMEGRHFRLVLIYFDTMDIKTLDGLSHRIHEPIESRAFSTLNTG